MLRLQARAKINWTLDILGRRADGYHHMDMLMSSVALADTLELAPAETLTLQTEGQAPALPQENLVMKAALALRHATGCTQGAALTLTKRTPVGAGMGGGSADAAATLLGLNQLWQLHLPADALATLALSLGADVPFMLAGGFARVGGIGEVLEPLQALPPIPLVIVQPCQPLSTRGVFAAYDALPAPHHPDTLRALAALQAQDWQALNRFGGNVLAQASQTARPPIAEAVAALDACGAGFAQMTGSGSAVFGAFASAAEAKAAYQTLRKRWKRCWLTCTATAGVVPQA